ncbi:hypothetical protein GCM10012288_16840 [Malaciobacter pacificus]|uniref:Uncharacterized protein n=1 Tax=Malaciobacter pacificus TaxID=1080223 RepID=A0A5C2H9C5_9BACT|nr:hypothetical protein [Malaciobacter pacificus]QEP34939.1 hypothetical protein APAC_1860 [Malaciobacter pacificus]GGD43179.1 hypothetical protein GCM10012288_16840 [Malaciobacter pacificus]
MKKINSLVLSTLAAAVLVGCGGGSSSSTSSTSVPVTKGPLIKATAVDQNGKQGTQDMNTDGTYSNSYSFSGEIAFPIEVTGGYVDVNNNGIIDAGDYPFSGKLSSYSKVVTPITTYLGDTTTTEGKAKLEKLKELTGASDDDLLITDPADTNANILSLNAAIFTNYPALMDDDDTNDDIEDDIEDESSSLSTKFNSLKDNLPETEDLDEILTYIEQDLVTETGVTILSEFEADKINFSKDELEGKKLTIENETYYFTEDNIVLGDSGEGYTRTLSYGTFENGQVKLNSESEGFYDLLALTETGYSITYYESNVSNGTKYINVELVDYTETELAAALADVPFELTEDMISGKTISISDEYGSVEVSFASSGDYSEVFDDTISGGTLGTCSGTWSLNSNVISVTSECSDELGVEQTFTLTFNEQPAVGSSFDYNDGEESGTETIDAISDIVETSNESSSSGTLSSVVSGKSLIAYDTYGYVQANFYADGTYVEVGPNEDDNGNMTGTTYTCTGKWLDFGNNKIGTTCDGTSTPVGSAGGTSDEVVITFPSSTITNGSTATIQDSTETFQVTIGHIADLSNTGSITSFVSGKFVDISDAWGEAKAIFMSGGSYREYGSDVDGGSWSCSGQWRDFGNNKIAVTCEDAGSTNVPDGIFDDNEMFIFFSDNTPTVGEKVWILDTDELFEVNIDTDLQDYLP